jgi:hypothetical protein
MIPRPRSGTGIVSKQEQTEGRLNCLETPLRGEQCHASQYQEVAG